MLAAATSLADDLSALSDDELLLLKQLIDAEVEARGLLMRKKYIRYARCIRLFC